ncbi:hypothetical protein [Cytobacillus dafuensis]|uniref:hypothetical protein n=1 Tax=Cytobacillus dafuensis TaxID=1742359 RepID=UPI000A668306|nr:hypothetical protein [Cytobacillus dafuensis]
MSLMLITTIGFVISLGIVGILLFYFINNATNKEHSSSIDPIPQNEDSEKKD